MWCKAKYFKDEYTAEKILEEKDDPLKCKQLGRSVKNYNDDAWDKVRYQYMLECNWQKYSQNKDLETELTDHKYDNKTFVEASPTDGVWGIKMGLIESSSCPCCDGESN